MKEKTVDEEIIEVLEGYIRSLVAMRTGRGSVFLKYSEDKIERLKVLCSEIENR